MISACFTTYNRTDLLFEAIEPFLKDERITEIVISDDHSTEEIYQTILWKYNGVEKVKIFRNEVNVDCYRNKKLAIERATNEWVLILDSDNIFSQKFIDIACSYAGNHAPGFAVAPSFARPHFNFTELGGCLLNHGNIAGLLNTGSCSTMLNAMNYLANRPEYLRVWDGSIDPVTSDSIFHNYNWLKAGNSIWVDKDFQYEHRVHEGSHYQKNHRRTAHGFHDSIIEKLKQMQ